MQGLVSAWCTTVREGGRGGVCAVIFVSAGGRRGLGDGGGGQPGLYIDMSTFWQKDSDYIARRAQYLTLPGEAAQCTVNGYVYKVCIYTYRYPFTGGGSSVQIQPALRALWYGGQPAGDSAAPCAFGRQAAER